MQSTKLLYLEDMHSTEGNAVVVEVGELDGRQYVVLDQTILYAQGGGQPADHGSIESEHAKFVVNDVRFKEGMVYHFGEYVGAASEGLVGPHVIPSEALRIEGSNHTGNSDSSTRGLAQNDGAVLVAGDAVTIHVDAERRMLHARLHSAAHVIDMVVAEMNLPWTPGKGYHFPDGPYVEYAGSLEGVNVDELKARMEQRVNELIATDISTRIQFASKAEMAQLCRFVPEYLPEGKPTRVVLYGNFGVPCGGTHVAHLSEIGLETIRKIKVEKGNIRVGYDIDRP